MLRKTTYVFAILILLCTGACKKDLLHLQKVQQLNSNTTARLNHIQFLGDNICIINGGAEWQQSEVLRSTDGGYTWANDSFPSVPLEIYGMGTSVNGNIYLSTTYGNTLRSSDSGKSWQYNRITDYLDYVGGTFVTPDTGIFVSTVLQRQCTITRVDSNFNILDEQTFLFGLNNLYMTNTSVGYAIGYGAVMATKDRGNTWTVQDVNGDNFEAMDVHGDEIWMCGYNGSIYHTIDGGNNWTKQRNGNDVTLPRYNLLDIKFKDGINGWAVCDNGKMIHTDDGGQHWEEYQQFTTSALRSIVFCPNGDLLVAGDNGSIFRVMP